MANSAIRPAARTAPGHEKPQPLARMQSFAPYKQGKSAIPGRDRVIKLSSNESCFGPSPATLAAYERASAEIHRYPDGSQTLLREAIARVHDIDADCIVCGNGSEELIGLFIRCYLGEGDEILLSQNHFMMCSIYGKGQGADIVLAPERDDKVDVDAMLARITPRTRVLSVANPNNPTGTYIPASEVRRLVENTPKDVLIILDGAYAEYVMRDDFDDGMHYVREYPNVVVTRTFSKIYGLAGLRIGWAYGPAEIIEVVNRLRTPFNASGPALAAAAAAMADQEHVRMTREHTAEWQVRMREGLEAMGVRVLPSVTNFYLVDFQGVEGKTASDAAAFLEANGIIPRPGSGDRYLRITIGTIEENEAVLEIMSRYLAH